MTIELFYDSDHAVEVELAEIGHRESNDYNNYCFSGIGGSGINWTKHWSTNVRYDYLEVPIKLGTLLNDINITSMPYTYKITPALAENKGIIGEDKTVDSGFTLFKFGGFSAGANYCSVKCAVDIDYNRYYSSCYLAHGWIDDKEVIGFLGIDTRSSQYPTYLTPYFIYNEDYSDFLLEYVTGSPGEKGYRPTGTPYDKNKPGVGGKGHKTDPGNKPSYDSDNISNPGAPDESSASAMKSGLIHAYKMTEANLAELTECLYGTTLGGLITNLAINPLDFIVSLNIFPASPDVGTSTNVVLGKWLCTDSGIDNLGGNVVGAPLSNQFKVFDFGTVNIREQWGSFLDYTHTQIELYLPFIGVVDIDTAEVMEGSIALEYTVDYLTGMCVANVNCNRTVELPDGRVKEQKSQHSFQGNCAMSIPLSQQQYGNMIGSLINAGTAGMKAGIAGVGISVASDVASGGFKPNVTTKGSISANAGFCSILYPYIRITRPISAEPESFQEAMGYPSYINSTLGDCDDLCICESIDLHTITGATASEIERIRQACLSGVHV